MLLENFHKTQYQLMLIRQQRFYSVCQKTRPLHYRNEILKEIIKCWTIQRENVNRGHAATFIATNVQNGVLFHGHKPGDVVSIRQSPHRQLSAVRQTRPHSDAAAVGLSKVSKVIQSGHCPCFCCKFFDKSVSYKSSNSYRFLKIQAGRRLGSRTPTVYI